jgi:hypothetical protein
MTPLHRADCSFGCLNPISFLSQTMEKTSVVEAVST